jgi:folate-binding protein YgfZ
MLDTALGQARNRQVYSQMNATWHQYLRGNSATAENAGAVISRNSDAELEAAKSGTIFADLSHFGLIRFGGENTQQFLNGQLSCDLSGLEPLHAQYGSYSTPQGRMLASFLLWREDAGFFMQLPRSLCDSIQKRISMYILRSKVKATDASDEHVLIGVAGANARAILNPLFGEMPAAVLAVTTAQGASLLQLDANRYQIIASPERAPQLWDAISKDATRVGPGIWDWFDIRAGIPFITPATQEQLVPQMANLDLIGGVSFGKGCYPGQEIVARMHYLGRLKQRMYLANIAAGEAPQPGDKLFSADMGEQASGIIVSAAPSPDGGYDVLAAIRIESFKHGDVRWRSLSGPGLKFGELPYKLG